MTEHALAAAVAKAADEAWQREQRDARKAGTMTPPRPPDAVAPDPPPRGRIVVNDSTLEELQLASHPRGLLYFRDELGGWLGNLDRYGGAGGDRAFFLEAWNGGPYNVDRVKHHGSPLRILMNSLSILGGMQPDRVKDVLGAADDGLVARFAFVWPAAAPIVSMTRGSYSDPEPTEISGDAMVRACTYVDYLGAMFERVTAGCTLGKHEADARAIAQYILSKKITTFHPRDLYRLPGWRWLRDEARRDGALQALVKAGWLRLGLGRVWEVNPAATP